MGHARHLSRVTAISLLLLWPLLLEADDRAGVLELPVKALDEQGASTVPGPDAAFWSGWAATPLWLNQTPPLYADAQPNDGGRPTAGAHLARLPSGGLLLRLRWTDASRDLQPSPWPAPDQGADRAGLRHTSGSDAFADRACVMWPEQTGVHGSYPSLVMGARADPVRMACWTAGQGFSMLAAAGRGSVRSIDAEIRGASGRADGHWTVVFELPSIPDGTPLAFGVWDGALLHRDGLKFFSLWYQLTEAD